MKIENRYCDHQHAPRSKFMQQMRQIKIQRLRPMNSFAKSRNEFAHDDFVEKLGLKKDATDHPQKKNSERRNPRPPATPCAVLAEASPAQTVSPAFPMKYSNRGKQKCVNNRSLDQHCGSKQCKDEELITRSPRLLLLNFPPDQ